MLLRAVVQFCEPGPRSTAAVKGRRLGPAIPQQQIRRIQTVSDRRLGGLFRQLGEEIAVFFLKLLWKNSQGLEKTVGSRVLMKPPQFRVRKLPGPPCRNKAPVFNHFWRSLPGWVFCFCLYFFFVFVC